MNGTKDQRRSQRIRHELVVEIHDRQGARRLHAVDVARHGLFLVTDTPPRERHLVQLTVHLPDGPIRAAASVTRKGTQNLEGGVGVQFFALSDEAKQKWDDFIFGLQRGPRPANGGSPYGATFLVKLKSVERLKEFSHTHLAAGGTVLFTPVLRGPGEMVTLIVVHPRTDEEFRLPGVIHKAHADRPKRIEIHFHGITPTLLNSFAAYVETGHPPAVQLETPPVHLLAPAPPADLDLDVDVFDEDTLETDDRIGRPADVELPAPSAPVSALDPGLRPAAFVIRCDRCDATPYAIDLGPCRGVLGLVADHMAFLSQKSGRVVTAARLVSPEERQGRTKAFLAGGGRLDTTVDLLTFLGAAALGEAPKDPDSGGGLKNTRAVERLEHAARRLSPTDKPAKTRVTCPSCKAGHLTVEKVAI